MEKGSLTCLVCAQVFLGHFLEMGLCAVAGHVWNLLSYYLVFFTFFHGISLEWVGVRACGTLLENNQI